LVSTRWLWGGKRGESRKAAEVKNRNRKPLPTLPLAGDLEVKLRMLIVKQAELRAQTEKTYASKRGEGTSQWPGMGDRNKTCRKKSQQKKKSGQTEKREKELKYYKPDPTQSRGSEVEYE